MQALHPPFLQKTVLDVIFFRIRPITKEWPVRLGASHFQAPQSMG
jgi:hypothetical protein